MMPNFDYLRISLAKWEDTPLFRDVVGERQPMPRTEVLREIFSEERDFVHRARLVTFLPVDAPEGYVAGYFGREVRIHGHSKREDRFEPEEIDTYDLAFIAINLATDQQIALVQENGRVGSPRALLQSLFASIPVRNIARDYQVHVINLSSEKGYYAAAEEYKGRITEVIFTFIPPNALKAEEKVWAFIEDASKRGGSELIKHQYNSSHGGLDPAADIMAGSERVAALGGGETVMRAGRKTIFRSTSHRQTTYVNSDDMPESWNAMQIAAFIKYIFGRKDD